MSGQNPVNGLDRTIFVFDNDSGFRDELFRTLRAAGHRPVSFADGPSLLAAARMQMPLCMVIEIRLQNGSGMEILKELRAQQYPAPVFATSPGGDIATAVSALKLGAMDFIQKPSQVPELLARIDEIVRRLDPNFLSQGFKVLQFPGQEPLSDRELQVAEYIVTGASSKQIARMLGISPRTVGDHRHRIMRKLSVRSIRDVVRLLLSASRA